MASRPHALAAGDVLQGLGSSAHGLDRGEARSRLATHGPNALPRGVRPGAVRIFLAQFKSPLIYVLLAAALASLALQEWVDAGFIGLVLLINAVIGAAQELNAQRSADSLASLAVSRCRVVSEGEELEVPAEELVPGDVVLLETGVRVPADLRLLSAYNLDIDESLLTGESMPVAKDADRVVAAEAALGDRPNMAFAGTLVTRGRGRGVVVGTGGRTELGAIAGLVLKREVAHPPLLLRMHAFTRGLVVAVALVVLLVALVSLLRGHSLHEVFLLAVALAVSVTPEGLPVALTIALAVATRRMAKRKVIVRKLVAVEGLGSCTFIASDKTGTLTMNQLTVKRLALPGLPPLELGGEGDVPRGELVVPEGVDALELRARAQRLLCAVTLCNEATLALRDDAWTHHGDAVDVSLLVAAHKLGITRSAMESAFPRLADIPFESDRQYAATLNRTPEGARASVKGALERLLPMCATMAGPSGDVPLDPAAIQEAAHALADGGYRVLAVAAGDLPRDQPFTQERLTGLTLLGLVGTIDPLRPATKGAIEACRRAGVEVAMVTGDHPTTALAIARELGLARDPGQVVTGPQLAAADPARREALVANARVFARVEPRQKLEIVEALKRAGHFVAVTGDGANDAPALRAAHVGVAMGKSGTDVARETADLVLTDDDFASIVAGIEEGRVAYANVRKVVFLLLSTGLATIVAFVGALMLDLPMLFVATQVLWVNLVTSSVQDVALAFEPAEGDELDRPPRPPREPIFDRWMTEGVLISGLWMGGVTVAVFWWLLAEGWAESSARNAALLLMVLFQNIHVGNARAERRSSLTLSPFKNRFLFAGTLVAQLLHVGAMYTPGVRSALQLEPVSLVEWVGLLGIAVSVFFVIELYKLVKRWTPG